MSKIPFEYEGPVDIVLAQLWYIIQPSFHDLNFRPNDLTTISVIFGLFSVYCLYEDYTRWSALFLFLSYFFDIADGIYARTYNMVTEWGDYYDHISDIILFVSLFGMIMYKYYYTPSNNNIMIYLIIVFLTSQYITGVQLGCQEKIYVKDESGTLKFLKNLCRGNPKTIIKYTRFCSSGTTTIILMLLILNC